MTKAKLPRRKFLRLAAGAAALPAVSRIARAQTYPRRPVKFIVPFGPASGADITARLFADRLATRWGKPVIVENRPGGDGLIGVSAFVAAKDEHSLLFSPVGTFAVHPYSHERLPYSVERDLLPIASATTIVLAVSVSESLKVRSLADIVALARAQPGKLNAAAANGLTDFLLFGFLKDAGLHMAKVPYRDINQAPNDLAEGRIQVLMTSLAAVQPQMQTGRIQLVAVSSSLRAPSAPEVLTVVEAGYPKLALDGLVGLFGPRGMSSALRERIAADFRAVVAADTLIATRLEATGQIVDIRGPAEFAAGVEEQRAKLAAIAKTLGIKPAQ
jgi:tripartite-type tricarboxylate transporter receptor subunit TctC